LIDLGLSSLFALAVAMRRRRRTEQVFHAGG